IAAHDRLLRTAVEADHLREHLRAEHRHAARLFLEDDLEEDRPRQVLAGLRVDDLKVDVVEHHLLHVGEGDVAAVRRVVEAPVGVLLDDAGRFGHAPSGEFGVDHYNPLIYRTFDFGGGRGEGGIVRRNKKSLTWPFSVPTMDLCDAAIALRERGQRPSTRSPSTRIWKDPVFDDRPLTERKETPCTTQPSRLPH